MTSGMFGLEDFADEEGNEGALYHGPGIAKAPGRDGGRAPS